ncbi:ScbA/BarX family gamma-butyrolactone biosynthesis protein [Streptomyces sp. NPDC047928]|uniref:ScbA/BarX family gamma-butyrolactone biosynthesis protein n=1 Tax=unclassified Streptomyces TaxID=2593676 RepID=UPI003723D5D7
MHDVALVPPSSIPSPTPLGAYTHLQHDEFLLVTGWQRATDRDFTFRVTWPAVQGDLAYDPRLLAQTVRQTGLVVAHAEYGVPLTHQTMLSTLGFTISPGLRLPRDRPSALDVQVTVAEAGSGRRANGSLRMDFHVLLGGATVARAEAAFGWISPGAYRRVRGDRVDVDWGAWPLPEAIGAEHVGRASAADVVLAAGDRPGRWLLRNDTGNRLLFDHPVDHVPGLALLEAAHQAAHALPAPAPLVPSGIAAAYQRYVEFDRPCWIEAASLPAAAPGERLVRVTGTQDGQPAFTVDFTGPGN